ncbi:GlsB/YeaQ/YmgE family stress response membrane protein [uncultured Thiodictyon sp.]|uniref:GlsB/YeaQ/YmgE family stress response membrane protein n=1 Tax=uncultured Thiodictyon sp. TaxID=1846217 RepID=UPI0025D129F3|nr:GlsB/YeaQ/YmgE family stress response membrane protein [uncultured Thiodictyon sp.]
MDFISLTYIAAGAALGWLVAVLVQRGAFGRIIDLATGGLGAWFGGYVFGQFGLATQYPGWHGTLGAALIGAAVLLFVLALIRRS